MKLIDADALLDSICGCFSIMEAQGMDMTVARTIAKGVIDAASAVDAAPTVNDWISVNDRMPDNGQDVLVYIDDYEESRITGCNYSDGVWYDCVMNCEIVIPNITHWMPIPEPPKEEDDDEVD